MRIAVLVDSWLSPRLPERVANWHASRRAVERLDAQLTVHLGQLTLDNRHADDLDFAARMVRRWPTELRGVPSRPSGLDERLMPGTAVGSGPVVWHQRTDDWLLVGVAQVGPNAGGAAQAAQRDAGLQQLADRLVQLASRPWAPPHMALFCHRPLPAGWGATAEIDQPVLPQLLRESLLAPSVSSRLRLVLAGHDHLAKEAVIDGVHHVWMPPHGTVLSDGTCVLPSGGAVGMGLLKLRGGGSAFELWCPDGLQRKGPSLLPRDPADLATQPWYLAASTLQR